MMDYAKTIAEVLLEQSEMIRAQQVVIDRLLNLLLQSDVSADGLTLEQIRNLKTESERLI